MKIAIVGSRNYSDLDHVRGIVKSLSRDTEIVSGGAPGVDKIAEQAAIDRGMPTKIFPADWEKYGRGAGAIRNKAIVNYADGVIAFWDGTSRGTKNTIDLADKQSKLWGLWEVRDHD